MGSGVQFVTTDGTTEMLRLCADSYSTMDVSRVRIKWIVL